MIIPWGTDAPIYHRPWATIALMAATVAAFFATAGMDPDDLEPYLLSYGRGLHPVQWVTSNFLHGGPGHLFGNLVFLWTFALIVEGKLGFLRFLGVFLGIGFLQCGLEQLLTLGMAEGVSLGNSAIVYGIMAMAMVWAPKNELTCFWAFGFRFGAHLELPILMFALLYIGLEIFSVLFWGVAAGFSVTSSLLHLSGAAIGFGVGTALLRLGWVDCEKWDLYSVMGGHQGQLKGPDRVKAPKIKARKPKRSKVAEVEPEDRAAAAHRRLKAHLDAGSVVEAHASYDRSVRTVPGWVPTDADWLALIQALLAAGDWGASATVMGDYLRRSAKPAARVRLRLAHVLVKELQRPAHALKVLAAIPAGTLPENLDAAARQLRREAERMIEEGVLELEGETW